MVMLKEISAHAIKVFGKILTFSSWNGIPYAKVRETRPRPPATPAQAVMRRRLTIASGLCTHMDNTVRDAYKFWAQGTSFTWRDLAIREIMTIWHDTQQTPLTLRHFDHVLVDGVLTVHVQFGPIMTDEGKGYGSTGWGNSPWGSPQEFLTQDGYLTPARWQLAYGDPLPWPGTTFTY